MTTIPASDAHGANTAERAPITTSTPARATSHCSGITAVVKPLRRNDAAPRDAIFSVGHTTNTGPRCATSATTANADASGGTTTSPAPTEAICSTACEIASSSDAVGVPRCGCTGRFRTCGADADDNTARQEPQKFWDTHLVSGTTSGSTP